ncbi:DNA topoisomerase 3 [Megasphaera paucivorans]|uniref:DNA topoisomerase n=1 Tax=Megasphaera paucivorans TaxID=349095 RepID=A0A1G9UAN9_9FIRM|nr:DNA topoisomerase 3 [Megasphaera paucivorans]SDM57046.1 DNA topoisomerase-3 [Megasphaera paucivorans]
MSKVTYIAEKPDIGKALATYLWPDGNCHKEKGFIQQGDTTVTWAFGHILGLASPEEYGEEYKAWANYPILPKVWKLKPAAAAVAQLAVIKKLLMEADIVVHAGDPDREGQLLIDEILHYLQFKGKVQRILINAKDDESLKRAFAQITDNKRYENLYYAGLGREQADWLIGMNLTRAYTVNARKYGYENTFRIGRVKVPTLALVVNREKEIKGFKSAKYYELKGIFEKDGIPFKATLKPAENLLLDEENRVKDKNILQAIKLKLEKAEVIIRDVQGKDMVQHPPLPHSLDTLQVEANKKYGFSPKEVLVAVQDLYEKKYVSYPRSDCNYIPVSQKADAVRILPVLSALGIAGANTADIEITSKAFNDQKITAHHAIIPTGIQLEKLSEIEQKIYELIAKRYVLQFFPAHEYKKITFTLVVADEIFTGSGKVILKQGYKAYELEGQELESAEDNVKLPTLKIGDIVEKANYSIADKVTVPPKRFTEGTLLAAMANIWRFVDAKNPNREKLKEVKGIGTPATRDTIIAELQADTMNGKPVDPCMTKIKKELVPTEFGTSLIENVDQSLTLPDATAEMEYVLSEIAAGQKSLSEYMDDMTAMVHRNIQFAENRTFPLPKGKALHECPVCSKGELIRRYSTKAKKHFHICSNTDCVSPVTGRKLFYEDDNGKPVVVKCPDCGTILVRILKNGTFWLCSKCNKTFNDKAGKPDFSLKKK